MSFNQRKNGLMQLANVKNSTLIPIKINPLRVKLFDISVLDFLEDEIIAKIKLL